MVKIGVASVILLLMALYVVNIFNIEARYRHSKYQNYMLTDSTSHLSNENESLSIENAALIHQYECLKTQIDTVRQLSPKHVIKNPITFAVSSIEQTVKSLDGWVSPDLLYDMIMASIQRKPTEKEYRHVLSELVNKNLVWREIDSEPLNIREIKQSEIDSVVNKYYPK
jgi:hypothetical protein